MEDQKFIYPIGNQDFRDIRESGMRYVDKTELIYKMTHEFRTAFLSRPRRFGKSLLCSTLKHYFMGQRELFEGLAIAELEKEWKRYPVIHVAMSQLKSVKVEEFPEMLEIIFRRAAEENGLTLENFNPSACLGNLIEQCHKAFKEKVVVIIDEYDAPLVDFKITSDEFVARRKRMRAIYSCLKELQGMLRFTFITGITKFSQLSIFSEINHLTNISLTRPYAAVCGITKEELHTQFAPDVKRMADALGKTEEQTYADLKRRYDGYHFSEESPDVYNPFSLVNALHWRSLKNYWAESGTPTILLNALSDKNVTVASLLGRPVTSREFNAPVERMDDPLPLFYQTGYLTIKGYDPEGDEYTLGFPNTEVRQTLMELLLPHYSGLSLGRATDEVPFTSYALHKALANGDTDRFGKLLKSFFGAVPYDLKGRLKRDYQTIFWVVMQMMGERCDAEVRTAKGRVDAVLKMAKYIYVIEFKIDSSAAAAIKQIKTKDYSLPYSADPDREVILLGINYSTKLRKINGFKAERM